jgi:ADP-heptose:LPS heptosyltransferase
VTKVLIIRCGALGDLVYATSVIDAMKKQFGEDTIIDFVSTPGTAKLFEKDDRVNQVFPLKHKKDTYFIKFSKKRNYKIL